MREIRYGPPPEVIVEPAAPAPVYVLPEPWVVSAGRWAGATLGNLARNTGNPYGIAAVREYARRHPFAMLAAAAAGFFTGRIMLGVADLLSER